MKKLALVLFCLILNSCVTTLEPDKFVLDEEQFELIEKILKHPDIISDLCNDSSIVSQHFIEISCSQIQQKWFVFFIENNFKGTNKIIEIEQLKNIERIVIINMKTNQKIYFDFQINDRMKKLYLINGPIEL